MSPDRGGGEGEAGLAGVETLPFAVLVFVVGTLLVANAWAVIDAKMAVSSSAREATRAFVEAPPDADPLAAAQAAADDALAGAGRRPDRLELTLSPSGASFARCVRVTFTASYPVPAVGLPWLGGRRGTFTAVARHSELVDPLRTGVPLGGSSCVRAP